MKNAICSIILSNLIFSHATYAADLALPASVNHKAVYYKKSQQLPNWSCGYNGLFRACELEGNAYRDFNTFSAFCLPHVTALGLRPTAGARVDQLKVIAQKLGLQKFQGLIIDEYDNIVPAHEGKFFYKYNSGDSSYRQEKAKQQALAQVQQNIISELKNYLAQRKNNITYIHFMCHVWANGEDHGILMSLVQNTQGGRSLYIYDNLNGLINEYCTAKRYIDYIAETFSVDTLRTQAHVLTTNKNVSYVSKLINVIDARFRNRA